VDSSNSTWKFPPDSLKRQQLKNLIMKNLIYLALSIFLVGGTTSAEAQFLKKLKKQVENAAVNNASDKAAPETDKSLNNTWSQPAKATGFSMGMDIVDSAYIPETYDFDWEYTLKVKTREGEMDMIYLIKENAPYFGVKMPQAENMITVLDDKNKMTVMFMNSQGSKMVMATITKVSEEEMEHENPYRDMKFEEIGTKNILGYNCQGYRSENTDHIMEFYVTEEAGISFMDIYQENRNNVPKGFDADWFKNGKGLLMEMEMTDKKDPKKNVSMICTGIEKKPFSIKTSEYQSMGGR
jgi:hypothetical protein